MPLELTDAARFASQQLNVKPIMVLCIDGVSKKYGNLEISEKIRIGDDGLFIDNINGAPWYIGGNRPLTDQATIISFQKGTTTSFTQQLDPDKGLATSVSNLTISMIDKNEQVSQLISPGFVITDLLGANVKVAMGFEGTAFPEDYVTIFRGVISDIRSGAGLVKLVLTDIEQKKRRELYTVETAQLTTGISSVGSVSTIVLESGQASNFPVAILGPDLANDPAIEFYVKINDEFFSYTGISGGDTLTGVTRNPSPFDFGQQTHDIGDDVTFMVRFQDNGVKLAQKLMLSGWAGPFETGVEITHINKTSPTQTQTNALFFQGVDVEEDYGLFAGDYVTVSGASNGANNVTLKQITEVININDGSYITIDGVTFVDELDTAATVDFRSQWDTLPQGFRMKPNEVNQKDHDELFRLFLSSFPYDYREFNGIMGKDFLDTELYRGMAAFSIVRDGRSSMGFHAPPLPGETIPRLDDSNVENAEKLSIERSSQKNFANVANYSIDHDINDGTFGRRVQFKDSTSVDKFKDSFGEKAINYTNKGLRTSIGGTGQARISAERLVNRYSDGAEFINGVEVLFGHGFPIQINDLVDVDLGALKITDTSTGNRRGGVKTFQVINKKFDLKRGKISLNLVDTRYTGAERYALVSPASFVRDATTTAVTVKESFSSVFGVNEGLKWSRFGTNFKLRFRSPDGTTRNEVGTVTSVTGNTLNISPALSTAPLADDIVEFPHYNDATDEMKNAYVFMRDTGPFDDGRELYNMV